MKSFKSVQNLQSRQVKCGLWEQIWCSMFKVDRCSMYPGSLPLIFNGSVPGHEKMFNVRRCSMYTGVQFDRFHCNGYVTRDKLRYALLTIKAWLCQGSEIWPRCDVTRRQRPMRTLVPLALHIKMRTNMRRTQLLDYSPQPACSG